MEEPDQESESPSLPSFEGVMGPQKESGGALSNTRIAVQMQRRRALGSADTNDDARRADRRLEI